MATPDIGKAWEYLQETTVGYKKLAVKPPTDKNSYWYKALVELGIIEAEEPPVGMGAALRAAFPPLTGLPVTDDAEKPSRGSVVLCDGSNAGGKHFKNVRRVGGSNDGYKIAGGAHDVRFDLCDASDIGVASQSMAWNFQRAPRNVQIYGGVAHNIGHTTRDHIAYVGAGSEDILFAGLLGYDFEGYGSHVYPGGGTKHIVHANVTLVGSRQRAGVLIDTEAGSIDDVLYVNSIIEDIVHRGNPTRIRYRNCLILGSRPTDPFPNDPVKAMYRGCIFDEDPGFDSQFKPTNPKLLGGGDPAWMAPWDCRGNLYTRATMGAVAA